MTNLAIQPSVEGSRDKLLAAAEDLFAARGYNGVSVRDIAAASGVNSALVGYYFGGKLGLLNEVYLRHITPLNQERSRLLKECIQAPNGPNLEQLLEAFLRPALDTSIGIAGRSNYTRLRAIMSGENCTLLEPLIAEHFDRTGGIFVQALAECLPNLSRIDLTWRFQFLMGALLFTGMHSDRILASSLGQCDPSDMKATLDQIIPFLAAGLRAASVSPVGRIHHEDSRESVIPFPAAV